MTLKRITLAECHQELLRIATIFDQLCQKHHIPYYMLGGTMLGAIRHKGFIPWDDDMDFGIPRPYFASFVALAEQELPVRYKLISSKNSLALKKGFVKIQLEGSKLIEKVFGEQTESFYNGIAIDIFPLDGVNMASWKSKARVKLAFLLLRIQEGRFCSLSIRKGIKKTIAYWIKKLPINDERLAAYIDKLIQKEAYESASQVVNFYGHWKEREIIDKMIFNTPTLYPFAHLYLKGVENYDAYLTALYHDYRKLPPKEKQITHADEFYIDMPSPSIQEG
ncbi:hypothetical protein B5F77_09510 [Parabacteroides sp. An277]|uniref:LicD family protein n=1 Tax=Parabacteroides sp. An277 TaxID=1965619 RepID=UPI000B38151E|nr:LicD family protein [Parabacteroides sp. An277]OUO51792.1 hypothetical protein B5F77_09510 [Parabacteroides sp. An277]